MTISRDTGGRRRQIVQLVRERGSVHSGNLAKRFGVSPQTIRKDLDFLCQQGVTERSHGGAVLADSSCLLEESPIEEKQESFVSEKRRIGAEAASLVRPGDAIILDSGTTTVEIARHLQDTEDITVLTNDFGVLTALTRKQNINVMFLGGCLRRKNLAFYGLHTIEALNQLHVDKLFLGVDGFDLQYGITTHYEPEALLNRKMAEIAREIIIVTDSSKFGTLCLHRIVGLSDIDMLITDSGLPDYLRSASQELGFKLVVAQ